MVLKEFNLTVSQKSKLSSLFPGKNIFSRQTDAFADARARSLDAYLQMLKLFMDRLGWSHPVVQNFFQIPELPSSPAKGPFHQLTTPKPEEWRELMGKGERLFELYKQDSKFAPELEEVLCKLRELIQHREFQGEERRFYDLKREIELFKIKNGQVDSKLKESFSLGGNQVTEASPISTSSPKPSSQASPVIASEQRTQLRFQDAILFDLEATVKEQKHLSIALAEEVQAHNQVISELQDKEESSLDKFKTSTSRVQKISK